MVTNKVASSGMKHLVWKLVTNILDETAAASSVCPEGESDRFH